MSVSEYGASESFGPMLDNAGQPIPSEERQQQLRSHEIERLKFQCAKRANPGGRIIEMDFKWPRFVNAGAIAQTRDDRAVCGDVHLLTRTSRVLRDKYIALASRALANQNDDVGHVHGLVPRRATFSNSGSIST